MKDQLAFLRELQTIDLDLDEFRKKKDEIMADIEANKGFLDRLSQDMAAQNAELEEIKDLQRQKADDVKDLKEQFERRKKRLHNVGSTKEYNAVEREISVLEKSLAQAQEELSHLGEVVSATEVAIADKLDKTKQLREGLAAEEAASADALKKIDDDAQDLRDREEATRGKVEKRVIYKYDFIRKKSTGKAITAARNGHCEGCFMALAPQLYIEIQRGETIETCPSCQRILFFGEEPEAVEAESAS